MSGWRRIDDDQVVLAASRKPLNFHQADELVDAGKREIQQRVDVGRIEPGAVLENVSQRAPILPQPARKGAPGVELHRIELTTNAARRRREPKPERVAERVCWIGRNDENSS